MNTFIRITLIGVLLILASQVAKATGLQEIKPDITDPIQVGAFVDGIVIPQMRKNHIPSGVVTLMKGGKIVFSKGYGYQDVDKQIPVNPDKTLFRPGSISKLFTWVSVMQQVEKGNLDLDADVNEYLKTFQIADTWPGQPITLRHIMSHTAGLEDGGLGYLIITDPDRIVPLAESLAHYIPKRINPPGKHTAYSNWATALAGLIVSNVSGVEFNEYVRHNIFDVLEMKSATFVEPLPENLANNMAKSYGWAAGKYFEKKPEIIANFGPAGSLTASSHDMVQFAKAILGGGEIRNSHGHYVRILEKSTTKTMLSHLHSQDLRTRGMAYGFLEYTYINRGLVGHDGATPLFLSHFGLSLEEDLMLFTSFSGPGALSVHSVFKDAFYNYFYPTTNESITPPSDFASRALNYEGTYQPWRSNFTKIEAINGALQSVNVSITPDNTLLIAGTRYVEEDKNLFSEVDGNKRIVFQESKQGEITGYITDGQLPVKQFYKAKFYTTLPFILSIFIPAFILYLFVVLRRLYQGKKIAAMPANEKAVFRASLATAVFNLLFVLVLVLSITTSSDIVYQIPWLLKLSLVFPIFALLATLNLCYQTIVAWLMSVGGIWSRIRLSILCAFSVMMIWLYNFWNLLGFNYFV